MADHTLQVPLTTADTDTDTDYEASSLKKSDNNKEGSDSARPHDHAHHSRPNSSSQVAVVLRQWWIELAACIFILLMVLAIFAVLYLYTGKTIPQWPYRLSINTVLAVLATALKAVTVLILSEGLSQLKWLWLKQSRPLTHLASFDSASRGPLGSLQLLFVVRRNLIASTGAILVVISLAISPVVQQLVRYHDCPQVRPGFEATIPQAYLYGEAGTHYAAGLFTLAKPLYGYIERGLFNPTDTKLSFECPTGNCTFDKTFSTLGWIAECEDMTDQLKIANVSIPMLPGDKLHRADYVDKATNTSYIWYINTTLPSGTSASFRAGTNYDQRWFTVNKSSYGTEVVLAAPSLPDTNDTFAYKHWISRVAKAERVQAGCNSEHANSSWACSASGAGAARCILKPAVKTYRASIRNGKLSEELLSTNTDFYWADFHMVMADLDCAGPRVRKQLQSFGFNITDDERLIPWNVPVVVGGERSGELSPTFRKFPGNYSVQLRGPDLTNLTKTDIVPKNCILQMMYYHSQSVISYVHSEYFIGSITPSVNDFAFYGDAQVKALFNDSYVNFKSVQAAFDAIADSLTARIREYGEPAVPSLQRRVSGEMIENATCVSVRWEFIAFPAAIVLLTILFLIAVIIKMATDSEQVTTGWKSSPLPLVLHEFVMHRNDGEGLPQSHDTGEAMTINEMEKMAKGTSARISVGEDLLLAPRE